MKLYAGRQVFQNELDKYVGKDIWILVHIDLNYRNIHEARDSWVRLFEIKHPSPDERRIFVDRYVFNEAPAYDFKYDPSTFTYTYTGDRLGRAVATTSRYTLNKEHMTIIKPLEVKTTDELFGEF